MELVLADVAEVWPELCRCGHVRGAHASHPVYRAGHGLGRVVAGMGRCIGHRWLPADAHPVVGCTCGLFRPMNGGLFDRDNEGEA